MNIASIKTPVITPKDDLFDIITSNIPSLKNQSILAITTKIVSITEGNIVPIKEVPDKTELIKSSADRYLGEGAYGYHFTIKHNILIPSAGIDESNGNGVYILWPKTPFKTAKEIWSKLRNYYNINSLGVILTDSHTTPLRRGVTGISVGHFGFNGVQSCIGQKDLFGRKTKHTWVNVADALAISAVFLMGETNECTPMAIIKDAPVTFSENFDDPSLTIEPELDLYKTIFSNYNTD